MPKPRKNTRAATRSRPRGGRLFSFFQLDGWLGALARILSPARQWTLLALAMLWRSRAARRLTALAAGAAVCVTLAWIMLGNLRSEQRFQVDPGRIELAADPGWAKPDLARRVRREIENSLRASLAEMPPTDAFDADLPALLAERLQDCPWVRGVVRVERRFPAQADGPSCYVPVLEVRRPALLVEQGDRLQAVDGDGVVLPLTVPVAEVDDFQQRLLAPLRVVKGVRGNAPGAGRLWRSEQINAALSMESILRKSELDRALPISAVELVGVPEQPDSRGRVHYAADGCVLLWPDQRLYPGARLIWGRPPVHASTFEASPNDKLAELRRKLDQPPEALVGTRIDLRRRTS